MKHSQDVLDSLIIELTSVNDKFIEKINERSFPVIVCLEIAAIASSLYFAYSIGRHSAIKSIKKEEVDNTFDDSDEASGNDENGFATKLIETRRSIYPASYTGKSIAKQTILKILQAATFAPTHHRTQPWRFKIYSGQSKDSLGQFLASDGEPHKAEKKIKNMSKTSHCIAIIVDRSTKVPEVEEVSSVAMAVQNMHLIASDLKIGMYWSSASVFAKETKKDRAVTNPPSLRSFLELDKDGGVISSDFCVGWLFVGDLEDSFEWPTGWTSGIQRKGVLEKCEFLA